MTNNIMTASRPMRLGVESSICGVMLGFKKFQIFEAFWIFRLGMMLNPLLGECD
jgi:hypothetical protein